MHSHSEPLPSNALPLLVNAGGAVTFVVQDETWPVFIEWVRKYHPEALPAYVDIKELREEFYKNGRQIADLVRRIGNERKTDQ